MAKKMTAEELNEILRKAGKLNKNLRVLPDDKYDALVSMRIAQAAAQAVPEETGEEAPEDAAEEPPARPRN